MLDPISQVISAAMGGEAGVSVGPVGQDKTAPPPAAHDARAAQAAADPAEMADGPAEPGAEDAESRPAGQRRGPKVKLDDYEQGRICGLIGAGLSQRQAALYLGFSPSAVSKALRRDKQFAADVARAMVSAKFLPLYKIIKASERSWRAAVWLHENAQPHTDLSEREVRRESRRAEKAARRQAEKERELRRKRDQEGMDDFKEMCKRLSSE